MAGRVDDYERTMAFADIALGQMQVVRQPASPRAAVTVAEHIRRISIGVATLRKANTEQSLIGHADTCLYAAKRHGRTCAICETDPEVSTDGTAEVA